MHAVVVPASLGIFPLGCAGSRDSQTTTCLYLWCMLRSCHCVCFLLLGYMLCKPCTCCCYTSSTAMKPKISHFRYCSPDRFKRQSCAQNKGWDLYGSSPDSSLPCGVCYVGGLDNGCRQLIHESTHMHAMAPTDILVCLTYRAFLLYLIVSGQVNMNVSIICSQSSNVLFLTAVPCKFSHIRQR